MLSVGRLRRRGGRRRTASRPRRSNRCSCAATKPARGARVVAGDAAQHAGAGIVGVHVLPADLGLAHIVEMIGVVERLQAGRLEGGVRAVDVGDVDVDRRLAADAVGAVRRKIEDAIVVEHRRRDRQRAVIVVRRRALEMIGAEVEEAVLGLTAQIDRRDDVLEVVIAEVDALKLVVVGEELVGQPGHVPAERASSG